MRVVKGIAWNRIVWPLLFMAMVVNNMSAYAERVHLLKDINRTDLGQDPQFATCDGKVFFTNFDSATGRELWMSDGVNTRLVRDIAPGSASPVLSDFASVGHFLYFRVQATPYSYLGDLWCCDARTGNAECLKAFPQSESAYSFFPIAGPGDLLYLIVHDSKMKTSQLWTSDGTAAGTTKAWQLDPIYGFINGMHVMNGNLYFFSCTNNPSRTLLWKFNEATRQGQILMDMTQNGLTQCIDSVTPAENGFYFLTQTPTSEWYHNLWYCNGTTLTLLISDYSMLWHNTGPIVLRTIGNTCYFLTLNSYAADNFCIFGKSDGTKAGTVQIKIFDNVTDQKLEETDLQALNGKLCFTLTTLNHAASELWVSDGTADGTKELVSKSGDIPHSISNQIVINNTLFFRATKQESSKSGIWKSDGSIAGTELIRDTCDGSNPLNPNYLLNVAGKLFFLGNDGLLDRALWKCDGSAAGLARVTPIHSGSGNALPDAGSPLVTMDGNVYFSADDGIHGYELWRSDGTEAGTVLVKDIAPMSNSGFPERLTVMNHTLYFRAQAKLWRSDGTTNGTAEVMNNSSITDSRSPMNPDNLTPVGNTLYFAADNSPTGEELWKSDGTATGTVLVKDVAAGSADSRPSALKALGGLLLYAGYGTNNDNELWRSDGTSAGTMLVKDINPGSSGSSYPHFLTPLGNKMIFVATTKTEGDEVWASDGTTAGTTLLRDIYPGADTSIAYELTVMNNKIYFAANDGTHGSELWRTDGTSAGTVMIKDICTTGSSTPTNLRVMGNTLYFLAKTELCGNELWKSDGTAAGTTQVFDLVPGPASSSPSALYAVGNQYYFFAADSTGARRLWKWTGSSQPPLPVRDFATGTYAPRAYNEFGTVAVLGNRLIYLVDDDIVGAELFVVEPDNNEAQPMWRNYE